MVHVSPNISSPKPTDCFIVEELGPSRLEICDLCWYMGDTKEKQCKEAFGVICCQKCYKSMASIER